VKALIFVSALLISIAVIWEAEALRITLRQGMSLPVEPNPIEQLIETLKGEETKLKKLQRHKSEDDPQSPAVRDAAADSTEQLPYQPETLEDHEMLESQPDKRASEIVSPAQSADSDLKLGYEAVNIEEDEWEADSPEPEVEKVNEATEEATTSQAFNAASGLETIRRVDEQVQALTGSILSDGTTEESEAEDRQKTLDSLLDLLGNIGVNATEIKICQKKENSSGFKNFQNFSSWLRTIRENEAQFLSELSSKDDIVENLCRDNHGVPWYISVDSSEIQLLSKYLLSVLDAQVENRDIQSQIRQHAAALDELFD